MKRNLYFLTLILASATPIIGQTKIVDIDFLNEQGRNHYYTQKDSAYFYFDKALVLAKANNEEDNVKHSLFNSTGVASYHYDLDRMGTNIALLDTLFLPVCKSSYTSETFNIYLYYKGDYQLKLSEYSNSRRSFNQIVYNIKNVPDSLKTITHQSLSSAALSFLGKIHLIEGKYDLAKEIYRQNIRTILKTEPNNLESLYGNYRLLAEVYRNENKYQESNNYLLKTYRYNKDNANTNTVITSAFNIAENYNRLSKKDSALFYLNEARIFLDENLFFLPKYHLGKAKIHKKNKEYNLALDDLNKCIAIVQQNLGDIKNSDIPTAYEEIGNIHRDLENHTMALKNYDLGLRALSKNSKRDIAVINLLKNKSHLLNTVNNKNSFSSALKSVDLGNQILDSLKHTFKSNTDKLFLIEKAFPLFESGIKAAYKLYTPEKDETFIEKAFHYTEKSKAVILLDALLGAKATKFANIPDALLEQESQLKSQITFLKKKIDDQSEKSNKDADELFSLQQHYLKLVETFEKDYPAYYDLRYNNEVASVAEVQAILADDELLISYFYGESAIYSIAISNGSKKMSKITLDTSLEKNITRFHEMLSNPKSDIDSLNSISNGLYQKLLASCLTETSKKKLIIVPDGLLNYIPLDALNMSENSSKYLVEDYAVSTINSVTLLKQLQKKKSISNSILAFAPQFDGEPVQGKELRSGLAPLPNNENEVNHILASFTGSSFFGAEASLSNFNQKVSEHNMVHLATHAVFDDSTPEYSYLAFTPKDSSDYVLYVSDIYNLKLDADLIALSACKTGIGELKKGEGAISLSRAFFYSGARSLVNTLWNIADNSASEIMGSFYENLADDLSKDVALQQAKLAYLSKNKETTLTHPYYWSSFVIQGNVEPIASTNRYWLWLLIGSGLLMLFIFFRKRLF